MIQEMLAAVEQQVADLQKKAIAAEQGAMGLAEARIAVSEGEMTVADYEKNFGNIIRALQKMSKGEAVAAGTMIDVMKKYQSGDPMVVAFIDKRIEEETRQRQAAGETNLTFGEVRQEKINSANMQIQARSIATGIGGAGTDEFQRDMFTDSLAFGGQAKAKGGQLQSIADQQQKAQVALFDSQKKGFEKIFANANQGLDVAVSRFQEAVDDFRELRGLAVSTEKATAKVAQDEKKVANLKKQLEGPNLSGDQRNALKSQLENAQQSLRESKITLKGARKKQDQQVKSANRKAKSQEGRAATAEAEEKRIKNTQTAQRKAKDVKAAIAASAPEEGEQVDEHWMSTLAGQLGMSGMEGADKALGVDMEGLQWNNPLPFLGQNQEISDMKSGAENKGFTDLFKNFSDQLLGEGTAEAAELAKRMGEIKTEVGAEGSSHGPKELQTRIQKLIQDTVGSLTDPEKQVQIGEEHIRAAKQKATTARTRAVTEFRDRATKMDAGVQRQIEKEGQ